MCVCVRIAMNGRCSVSASGMLDFTVQTMGTIPVLHFSLLIPLILQPNPVLLRMHTHTHAHTFLYSLFLVSGSGPEVLQLFLHLHFCAGSYTQTNRFRLSSLLQRQVRCVF